MAVAWLDRREMTAMILTSNAESAAQRLHRRARQVHPDLTLPAHGSLVDLLSSLPVLSKDDLVSHLELDEHWLETAVLFSETSGTTGRALQTPRGACDLAWNAANQANAYRRFVHAGVDRVAILHPSVLSPFIEASSIALRHLGIGQIRIFPIPRVCDYRRIFEVLARYRITAIMTTPSLAYKVLYEFASAGQELPPCLHKLLLTGEELSCSSIRHFKRIMRRDALVAPFVYGSSEAATLMLGRHDGLFDPILDDFIFELHDTSAQEGKRLVVTWLRDGLMPMVRYDTGDLFDVATALDPVLRFSGRVGLTESDREFRTQVERALHALEVPVYHFEGTFSKSERRLNASVAIVLSDQAHAPAMEASLREHLPGWQVRLHANPASMEFLQFSPSPKTEKLTSC
jgi:phenylacetate-CoA ligase